MPILNGSAISGAAARMSFSCAELMVSPCEDRSLTETAMRSSFWCSSTKRVPSYVPTSMASSTGVAMPNSAAIEPALSRANRASREMKRRMLLSSERLVANDDVGLQPDEALGRQRGNQHSREQVPLIRHAIEDHVARP